MSNDPNAAQFPTLVELLQHRASLRPDETCFTFLRDGTIEMGSLTYQELDRKARAIASALQVTSAPGERVLLLYPPGLDFIGAFFGCLYAGVVAVPAYPYRTRQKQKTARLRGIFASAEPTTILATSSVIASLEVMNGIRCIATDGLLDDLALTWSKPTVDPQDLAFLQYTSGSTSTPKGVMVSHRNLLHNLECISQSFEFTQDSVSVTWLPSYHDMGLILGIIHPVYGGYRAFLMAPTSFLQQPIRWLQAISHYRATHSGAPNFAYELCVNKTTLAQREGLDLGCWVTAYNGAEPIRAETLNRFSDTFEPFGFRSRFFYPCYGLAEATLMVTGGLVTEEPIEYQVVEATSLSEKTSKLVGCGRVHLDTRVLIVDPESLTLCAPHQVGEIWVSATSVAAGYWRQPDETEKSFRAHLVDTGEGPFLRTGDLGFLHDEELFVTGRLKDMFIVRGRNHYPQDIEFTAEQSHPAFRAGCGAVFTVPVNDVEQLVVAQEIERTYLAKVDLEEVAAAIRRAVAEEHELQVHAVVLLRPGTIPKTTSGKIQRHACRAAFLARTFDELGRSVLQPCDDASLPDLQIREELQVLSSTERRQCLVDYLRQVVSQVLGVSEVQCRLQLPLLQLGLDSLGATELKHRLEGDLGVVVPVIVFLQDTSIEEIADQITALLEGLSPEGLSSKASELPTAAPDNELEYPLSEGQKALWFLHQTAPQSAAYNVSFAARVLSKLDIAALREAFQILSDRHPALRTTIGTISGRPMQRLRLRMELDFEMVDAALWAPDELNEYLLDSSHLPFDLERGPLFRVRLCRRGPSEHILLLTAHHIVTDFWSLVLLLDELRVTYPALKAGKEVRLPPLHSRPADHAYWQADLVASKAGEKQWAYWRTQLAGAQSILSLPTDRPRPLAQTFHGATQFFHWDRELTARLRATAKSQGVTLYMLLLATFQVQLYRYTWQEDILVGSSVDGRTQAQFSGTVGYLVNQLALRARLSGNPAFRDFLGQVKQTVLGALAHQDVPFPLLVERLKPERDVSHSPMVQVMFVLQKPHRLQALASLVSSIPGAVIDFGVLRLGSFLLERRTAQFDVTLTVVDGNDDLTACWEYNRDLFDAPTISRMNWHLQTLLAAIIEDFDQSIATLPLLSSREREQMLIEWNQTQAPYLEDRCVHELFEAQAMRTPDVIAVMHADQYLTYRDLDERANQVAHHLVRLGVGPEALVGICVERSIEMVVALLGVLKAGGAYVPLDPVQPEERLARMLGDSNVALLLTQQRLVSKLPSSGVRVVCLDSDWGAILVNDREKPLKSVSPDNLAYVIYTSGSTGTPKGVMITHRGIVNYLSWCVDAYKVADGTGAPVNSSIGFDATVTSLFSPLLVGRKVVLMPEQQELAALGDALRSGEDFSIVKITPAHLELLKSHLSSDDARVRARTFIVGGEALPTSTVEYWQARAPGTRIINEYGPTETVVGCCVHDETTQRFESGLVPIGRPIANTELYLLDSYLQPVPVGVTGELYIGGVGVGRGYLARPDLTARKFIPHPFKADPQARLYRTGDLARYQADGTIEFLGRMDDQVKIRGFRIELGEIEAALLQHPDICESAVNVWQDEAGNKRLVAYVVGRATSAGTITNELRHFLERKLPKYMIPSVFVSLQELPLTSNGKVDRRNLPPPDNRRPDVAAASVPPTTDIEHLIATVWREVLDLDEVGIHDNFFDIGGHSILAAQVHQKLRERLSRDISIIELLEFPTISSLAKHLRRGSGDHSDFQPIHDHSRKQKQALNHHRQRRKDLKC